MVLVSFATIASALLATAAAQGTKIRYMPFGDSITEIVCWRALLWRQLQDAGYKDIDFVGSQTKDTNGAGCSKNPGYDKNHEGHGGYTATDIASRKQLVDWLKANPTDIITMHLGTNDLTRGKRTNDIIAAYSTMVQQMRDANPNMRIIVAQIITPSNNQGPTKDLNAAIPAWAASKNTTESPIWVVDQQTGYTGSDNRDGLHPGDSGDIKMAAKWYPAMIAAVKSLQNSTT